MPLVVSDAVVLHVFDYLESSRIVRLATRDAGLRSVLARGARRTRTRYGSALDLFAGGVAEFHTKPGRDLHTLSNFDITRSREELATDLGRFTAAAALAELALRFVRDDAQSALYEVIVDGLDAIGVAPESAVTAAALGAAWRLVAELGFAPALLDCAICHRSIADDEPATFHHRAGGLACERCARVLHGGRPLPARARAHLRDWTGGVSATLVIADAEGRAHQRLLREFLAEHLADGRALRAFDVWESGNWSRT